MANHVHVSKIRLRSDSVPSQREGPTADTHMRMSIHVCEYIHTYMPVAV